MLDSRILSRFGAQGFALSLSVLVGAATLHGAGQTETLTAPQTLQAQAGPGKPGQPPKAEDVFKHLDKNDDGKLDSAEVPQKMIDDFDDDKSGDIDLTEFKAHHKPQHNPGPKVDDHFKKLDINKDGKLDSTEIPQWMITDFDDDSSGDVDLAEFKAHHKPPTPPKPEDAFNNLDKNSDGKLDATEADAKMLKDFDDDNSGDIDKAEFKKHWRPKPPKPEDRFNDLDRNKDGKLDATEIPKALLLDWDEDKSGDVDLDEFKKFHKPPHGPGPGPGKGPGGPGGGPGKGPGKGPGGPGGGPKPPKPPKK